jgi:hypothetical protein
LYNVPAELAETIQMLQAGIWANDRGRKTMLPDLQKTFNLASGFQPYDLSPLAFILTPTFSPFRNLTPRNQRQGSNYEFKAITALDTGNASIVATEGVLANAITTQFADVTTKFVPYGLSSDPVTWEQQMAGEGRDPGAFNVDSRALATANLLKQVMIQEEKQMWWGVGASTQIVGANSGADDGDNWTVGGAVGTGTAPTLAAGTSGTMTGTVYVVTTQVTGQGEGIVSSAASNNFGTPTNGSLTITPNLKAGTYALNFKVYASTNGTNYYYQGTTNGAPFTLKSVSTGGAIPPTVDNSYSSGAFSGVYSYVFGSNTGGQTSNVAGVLSSMSPINTLLQNLWVNSYADPDGAWCHANEIETISTFLVGSGQPYYFTYQDSGQRDIVANARASRILNPYTQKVFPLNVHAYWTQGSIAFISNQVPAWYVGANIPGVWAQELTADYTEIDYPPISTQPTWLSEIRCYGALSCYIPKVNGVLWGIESASGVNP